MDGFLSMNSFEPVFWMLCTLALIRLIDGAPQPFWWTIFSLSAGIGLLNKPSILFFLIAAGIGLLLRSNAASSSLAGPQSELH